MCFSKSAVNINEPFSTLIKTNYNYNILERYKNVLNDKNKEIDKVVYTKISDLKFENQPLIKLFLGSNILLGFLFFVSKRSRGWLIYSLLALLYAVGFVASAGSIACFVMKYVVLRKKGKQLKKD